MSDGNKTEDSSSHFRLRSCILKTLYELFRKFPYAQTEPVQIMESCRTDANELNWNLVYLEKCGLVELGKAYDCHPFVACSAVLTAQGIDLIENEEAFKSRFAMEALGKCAWCRKGKRQDRRWQKPNSIRTGGF